MSKNARVKATGEYVEVIGQAGDHFLTRSFDHPADAECGYDKEELVFEGFCSCGEGLYGQYGHDGYVTAGEGDGDV